MSEKKECGATKRNGDPCGRPPGWGTPNPGYGNCKNHGGCTPTGIKHAEALAAKDAVSTYGLPREIDPHSALIEELHRTAGHVSWLGGVVRQLEQDDLTHLVVANEHRDDNRLEVIDERANVWLDLYDRERKHFKDVAKTCISVGIEERRVRIAEQQGELMAQVIRGLLKDLDIPLTEKVQAIVRRNLTLIQGGKAA